MEFSNSIKYIHEEEVHNLKSPSIIAPFIFEIFKPKSIVDVGCGTGTFLYEFKKLGVNEVLGIDGMWVDKNKLIINKGEFIEADLEKPIKLSNKFDLVLCLEVAEHLSQKSADIIVDSLTGMGNIIAFSAALKKQGGQNHVNEQPFFYWKEKFEKNGYYVLDLFRPYFWNNGNIQWWYKQNMFLIVHNSIDKNEFVIEKKCLTENDLIIHPELFYERMQEFEKSADELMKIKTGVGGNLFYYIGLLIKRIKLYVLHKNS
jgi:SAM-dependent methyltransferase